MSQGRGSADLAMFSAAVVLGLLVVSVQNVNAATYTVGGAGGWSFNVTNWPKGKSFRAGDILVFNYNPTIHNVVAVNRGSYSSCSAPAGAKVFQSGKDRIKLVKDKTSSYAASLDTVSLE